MKLISYSRVIEAINKNLLPNVKEPERSFDDLLSNVLLRQAIHDIKTIPVKEIVYCGECKHRKKAMGEWCCFRWNLHGVMCPSKEWFCACGEKGETNETD